MNKDIAQGKWRQLKRFLGIMQERYGMSRDEAEREFKKLQH